MQVNYIDQNSLVLKGATSSVIFAYTGDTSPAKVLEEGILMVGPIELDSVVHRPGEYEVAEVSIVALETKNSPSGVADMFNITVENVSFLFVVNNGAGMSKEGWDTLGSVDVVVVDLSRMQDIKKVLNRTDAKAVICVNYESVDKTAKIIGIEPEEPSTKLKFTEKDFQVEEEATALYLLGK